MNLMQISRLLKQPRLNVLNMKFLGAQTRLELNCKHPRGSKLDKTRPFLSLFNKISSFPQGVAAIDPSDGRKKANEASTAAPSLIEKIANRSICVHVKTIRLNGLSVISPSADCRLLKKTRKNWQAEALNVSAKNLAALERSVGWGRCGFDCGPLFWWNRVDTWSSWSLA